MNNKSNYQYLLSDLTTLKGVGIKTTNLLKKKNINNIFLTLNRLRNFHEVYNLYSFVVVIKINIYFFKDRKQLKY